VLASQRFPTKPERQLHRKPPLDNISHDPPLRHGLILQAIEPGKRVVTPKNNTACCLND
jgi:hypothetical protein